MKVEIVFLLAVIGQRLAGNLSSDDVAAIGEHGEKQRVHAGAFLKSVQDFSVPSSTNETAPTWWHTQGSARSGRILQEFAAFNSDFQHGALLFSLVAANVYLAGCGAA